MGNKNKNKRTNVVYSTNSDFDYEHDDDGTVESIEKNQQELRVRMEKRGGKVTTVVLGYEGPADEMKSLGKLLKSKCGVGGSAKDGEILVQGDFVQKVVELLKGEGYSRTK